MRKGNNILWIMVGVAVLALAVGVFMVVKRSQTAPVTKEENQNQTTNPPTDPVPPTPAPDDTNVQIPSDWKTYNNDKYNFSLQYPPYLKAGSVSGNSALGTFQVPVKGFHVGPLVLVVLRDADIKQQALDYFTSINQQVGQPVPTNGEPAVVCVSDKIENPTANVKSVSCAGEGGPASYAYIKGASYDVFVDGYSKGYDGADNGELKKGDYVTILSTFKFGDISLNPSPAPSPTPSPTPVSTFQKFTVNANDNGADLTQISVTKDNIVEITFYVSDQGNYYGGLDFRSSVINTGTIYSGTSKTISFKADKSFAFTPYWPSSNTAKKYKINVSVQ